MPLETALPRSMYFTIPEQKIIFNCVQEYLNYKPDCEDAKKIYDDFFRESWLNSN